jgi:peptidoglycan-associated lipoprotein
VNRIRVSLCVMACGAVIVAGCAAKPRPAAAQPSPLAAEVAPPPPPPPPPPPDPPPVPDAAPSEDELFARKSLAELNAERPLGTVHFAYDQADLRDDARAIVERNVEWMRRWPSTRVVIEGHCDERGTAEYNLALGDRRAQVVRSYMISLGIGGDRVLGISKGKEAPECTEASESCWRINRRGVPLITAK